VTTLALAVSGLLLLVTGLIRAAGASLVRTPRADAIQDGADGDTRALVVARLLDDRPQLQPALGVFHTSLLALAAIPATWALSRMLDGVALAGSLILLGLVLVLVGDLLPRSFGRSRPMTLAYRWSWLLGPVVDLGRAAADLVSDVDVSDAIVREVMVPRPDMVTVVGDESTDKALDVVIEAGRSRIPVLGEGIDDVVGVLYARDLLKLYDEDAEPMPSRQFARAPYFVPETKPVPELLREMQVNQVHLAIVVDEYGGTAGLVTIEDLLEEIVGEIVDEYDDEAPMFTLLDSGEYLLDARMSIDQLEELIGQKVPAEEWDTVGGLVLGLAGRVPREGETFDLADHVFVADQVQGRRISRVRVAAR
jgi:CBS domain containing-hemolysin-like protein